MTAYNRYSASEDLDAAVIGDAERHLADLGAAINTYRAGQTTFGQLTYELARIGGALEEVGRHADVIRPATEQQDAYLADATA